MSGWSEERKDGEGRAGSFRIMSGVEDRFHSVWEAFLRERWGAREGFEQRRDMV